MGRKATGLTPGIPGYGSRVAGQNSTSLRAAFSPGVNIKEVFMMKSVFSRVVFPLVLFILLFTSNAYAGQVTLMWDPPAISADVVGYVVDYGTASGTYTQGIDVGNTTSHTVANLPDGQTYYFAVVAYNSAGTESGYSNEVSKTMEIPQSPLTILKTGAGTGVVSGVE